MQQRLPGLDGPVTEDVIPMIRLSCPECGFGDDVPAEAIPPGKKSARCPDCGCRFPIVREAEAPAAVPDEAPVIAAAEEEPAAPEPDGDEALPAPVQPVASVGADRRSSRKVAARAAVAVLAAAAAACLYLVTR